MLWLYLSAWVLFCGIALALFLSNVKAYSIVDPAYRRFLLAPWKLATFAVAAGGLAFAAPYTGDPTWDYIDAAFMSALTFLTAPWSVGILFRSLRERHCGRQTVLALCLWMFSASWSYDLYLLLRDGYYPQTWFTNIFASSVLYCSAGLLWSLDWRPGRGVTFAFLETDWFFGAPRIPLRKVIWAALPFMLLAAVAIGSFLVDFS